MFLATERSWEVEGVAVGGVGNRTGKGSSEGETEQRGGARPRDPTKDRMAVIHEDAKDAMKEMLASAKKKCPGEEQGEEQGEGQGEEQGEGQGEEQELEEEDLLIEEEINE